MHFTPTCVHERLVAFRWTFKERETHDVTGNMDGASRGVCVANDCVCVCMDCAVHVCGGLPTVCCSIVIGGLCKPQPPSNATKLRHSQQKHTAEAKRWRHRLQAPDTLLCMPVTLQWHRSAWLKRSILYDTFRCGTHRFSLDDHHSLLCMAMSRSR